MNIEQQIDVAIRTKWRVPAVTQINRNVRQEDDPNSYHEDYADWEWVLSFCEFLTSSKEM